MLQSAGLDQGLTEIPRVLQQQQIRLGEGTSDGLVLTVL